MFINLSYSFVFQGDNGKLELAVVGFTDTFEISPSIVNQDAQFVISVKNNKRLDYEQVRQLNFKVVIYVFMLSLFHINI